MDFSSILALIKAIGKESMMELVKSRWIQFCIGAALLLLSAPEFIRAIAELLK